MLLVVVGKRFLVYYPCDIFIIAISRRFKNKVSNQLQPEQRKTEIQQTN